MPITTANLNIKYCGKSQYARPSFFMRTYVGIKNANTTVARNPTKNSMFSIVHPDRNPDPYFSTELRIPKKIAITIPPINIKIE